MTTPSSRTGVSGFDQFFPEKSERTTESGLESPSWMTESAFTNYEIVISSPRRIASDKFMNLFRGAAEKRK